MAAAAGALLSGLAILPATGLLDFARLPAVIAPACPAGEEGVITRFDRESLTLTLATDEQSTALSPLAVLQAPLLTGMANTSFVGDFAALKPGVTIMTVVDRGPGLVGRSRGVLLEQRPAWLTPGTLVRACLAPQDYVIIAERRYLRVRSLVPLSNQGRHDWTQ